MTNQQIDFYEKSSYLLLKNFYEYVKYDLDYKAYHYWRREPEYPDVIEWWVYDEDPGSDTDREFWEELDIDLQKLSKKDRDELLDRVHTYFDKNYEPIIKYIFYYPSKFKHLFERPIPNSFIIDNQQNNCIHLRQEISKILSIINYK